MSYAPGAIDRGLPTVRDLRQANKRYSGGAAMTIMYHDGNRRLQDQFDSRRISDRLEEKLTRTAFTADDKAFIESTIYFFLSTADAEGKPDCSFKGGPLGFVRVTGDCESRFPTTTETECSRASAICWSMRMSPCCSSICISGHAGCASTAARRYRQKTRCWPKRPARS